MSRVGGVVLLIAVLHYGVDAVHVSGQEVLKVSRIFPAKGKIQQSCSVANFCKQNLVNLVSKMSELIHFVSCFCSLQCTVGK